MTPDRIATVAGRTRLTYAALAAMSDGLAGEFVRRRIGRGDRIAIFSDNWTESVIATIAALKAGAVAAPIHPLATTDGLSGLLRTWRARALITEARLATVAAAGIRTAESVRLVVLAGTHGREDAAVGCIRFEDAVARSVAPAPTGASDTDIAFMLADGEPGRPAAASLLRHRDLLDAIDPVARDSREEDAVITSLRLATRAGLCQLFAAIRHGVTLMHSTGGAADNRPVAAPGLPRPLRSTR